MTNQKRCHQAGNFIWIWFTAVQLHPLGAWLFRGQAFIRLFTLDNNFNAEVGFGPIASDRSGVVVIPSTKRLTI